MMPRRAPQSNQVPAAGGRGGHAVAMDHASPPSTFFAPAPRAHGRAPSTFVLYRQRVVGLMVRFFQLEESNEHA